MEKKYCKLYRKTHHYIPIYGVNINIVFNSVDYKYLCKKYQDFEYKENELFNGLTLMNPENEEITIGIFNNDLATVVHECTHAALFILRRRCMNPDDSNGEAIAYLMSYLYDLIAKRMKKSNK